MITIASRLNAFRGSSIKMRIPHLLASRSQHELLRAFAISQLRSTLYDQLYEELE